MLRVWVGRRSSGSANALGVHPKHGWWWLPSTRQPVRLACIDTVRVPSTSRSTPSLRCLDNEQDSAAAADAAARAAQETAGEAVGGLRSTGGQKLGRLHENINGRGGGVAAVSLL